MSSPGVDSFKKHDRWASPAQPNLRLLLALFLLSIVAYSQNARINQYIDKVERLRRARRRLAKALTPLGIPALLGAIGALVT